MEKDIEILVHVSAPTTRFEDDRYRSQAAAYYDFETCGSGGALPLTNVEGNDSSSNESDKDKSDLPHDLRSQPSKTNEESSFDAVSNKSFGSFPSFVRETEDMGNARQSDTWPGMDASDGSPWRPTSRIEQLELLQASWRIQQKTSHPDTRPVGLNLSGPSSTSNTEKNVADFLEDTQLAAKSLESQLYSHQSITRAHALEEAYSERFLIREHSQERRSLTNAGTCSPSDAASQSQVLVSQPNSGDRGVTKEPGSLIAIYAPQNRSVAEVKAGPDRHLDLQPSTDNAMALQPGTVPDVTGELDQTIVLSPLFREDNGLDHQYSSDGSLQFKDLPSEVFPPAPNVSVDKHSRLPSQTTGLMNALKQQNSEQFRPKYISRRLNPDERGYWLVETANWPVNLQLDFWHRLSGYIRAGHFGWAVTLHRGSASLRLSDNEAARTLGQLWQSVKGWPSVV